jgi:hypothetical protein
MTRDKLAIEQTSGPERINIHGAINLESGQTRMIDVQTVDATSTITLLEVIEALYPLMMLWGLMHRNVTHDKCYATCAQFADASLVSCANKFLAIGLTSAIQSPTTSAPSRPRMFWS